MVSLSTVLEAVAEDMENSGIDCGEAEATETVNEIVLFIVDTLVFPMYNINSKTLIGLKLLTVRRRYGQIFYNSTG